MAVQGQPLDSEVARCSSPKCGRKILWIQVDGMRICVDPIRVRLFYPLDRFGSAWTRGELGYVPHFKTCRDPERFSKP